MQCTSLIEGQTNWVTVISLPGPDYSPGSSYVWDTVSLKDAFGQNDVPHHENTAGVTGNTST